jgi:Family of unknown function (DUF5681)
MTARKSKSAPYQVGYGKPPRHAQFRKGKSGNPGGRPQREPIERLKALTLHEAYRMVIVMEDGVAQPVSAVEAILRSQIELARNGNVRAQRDILTAVRTFEREEAAAADAYSEALVQVATDVAERLEAAERAAPTVKKEMSYAEAAQRVTELLGLNKSAAKSATGAPGQELVREEPAREEETTEKATEPDAAAPAPFPDGAQQRENGTASTAPPVASPPRSAAPPAAPPVDARPRRSPPRYPARESTPSPGAALAAGPLHNRRLPSAHSRRQKSGDSLINSLFSGNPAAKASPRNNRITNCHAPRKRGTQ